MVHEVRLRTHTRRRSVLAVVLTGQIMASIDGSIVSVAAQSIRSGLRADDTEVQLIVSGYLLTTGVLFVTCARIGDVIGHRRAFLIGVGWFTAASLLCGLSVNPTMLVLARIGQAAGAALLMPQVFSLIHRNWSGAERRRAIGLYSMVLALGVALGQVLGGLVVGNDLFGLGWRPVFLMNLPIGVVVLFIGARLLPNASADAQARLDPAGVALLTGAMTAITLPLIFGAERGWPTWVWIMFAAGGVLMGVFVRHETRARHPVLDLAAFEPPEVRWGMVSCCIVMGCYTAFLLILTLHLQSELGFTPLQAGLAFVPYAIGFGALSLSWTSFGHRVRHALPIVGPVAYAAGLLSVVVLFGTNWSSLGSIPLLFVAGAGHASGYSPLIAQITARVGPRLASAVSAHNSTGPVLAEVIAVAGLGSVYFAAPTSSDGLFRVTATAAALLVVAAVCGTMAASIGARRRADEPPVTR